MRTRGENFLKEEEALLFSERGFFRGVGGNLFFWGVFGSMAPTERKKSVFGFCEMIFLLGRGSAGQGGRGDSDLPPMPPWTPYTPFKRPRDTPGPPLYRYGHFPLSLDRQGPHRASYLVWPGARNQSDAAAGTHLAWPWCRGAYRCMGHCRGGPLPTLQG